MYTEEQPFGKYSRPVVGSYTIDQALRLMLQETGLTYRFVRPDVVTLERILLQEGDQRLQLEPTTVEGQALRIEETQVTAERERAYTVKEATTATKTRTPILETPASIQVVPEQVIEDQAPRRLRDVYRNVSEVQPDFTGGNVSATEVPIIRGFQDFSIYRNGFRTGQLAPLDFANVERVEVLKGPSSVLYGLAEPGGLLNIVTKRPVDDTFAILEQEFGSYDRYRTTIDANAPLLGDGSLLGRINLAYTSDDTFRDHDGIDRIFVAPTLAWRPSDATELILDFSYSYEKYPFDHGLAFSAAGRPVADVSTFLGEPNFRSKREEIFAGYTFTHDFTDRVAGASHREQAHALALAAREPRPLDRRSGADRGEHPPLAGRGRATHSPRLSVLTPRVHHLGGIGHHRLGDLDALVATWSSRRGRGLTEPLDNSRDADYERTTEIENHYQNSLKSHRAAGGE
ncbi:MAG: TonB-dependent receptor [Thermodesulfobacteriota bacterium]